MSNAPTCPDCGAPLGHAARGLCPRCLAELAVVLDAPGSGADAEMSGEARGDADAAAQLADQAASGSPAPGALGECAGSLIGRYQLVERLGEGGFGVVWMAEQLQPVRRQVALKIIKPGMDSREVIARFEAERQALALMDHANIAKVLDGGATEAGRPYFVMELVRGVPLTEFCDQKSLSTQERLKVFMQVCHAVQHAHQKGIIHRDLKPGNILVTASDGKPLPKIIDFGVAKALGQKLTEKTLITAFQRMIGTPAYMSPEQAELNGLDVDTRSDIYSLGVLLYELLTGVTPFDAETLNQVALDEIRRMIRETDPPKPSTRLQTLGEKLPEISKRRHTDPATLRRVLHGDLDWIVMKCLEKDRIRRYDTANALALDVEHHLVHQPVTAAAPSPGYRLAKFARRHRVPLATIAAFVLLLVAGTVISVWQALQARRSAADATRLAAEESRQRSLATASAEQSRERLVRLNLANGNRLMEEGDYFGALPWFSEALRSHQGLADKEAIDRMRLTTVMNQSPRLLQMWFHEGVVNTAEFSPDGKYVVTCSDDQTARVWDVNTGEPVTPALWHSGGVACAHFSPDGHRVLTAGRDNARLWNAANGRLEVTLEHEQVEDTRFGPDGRRVATASYDGTVKIWDVSNSRPVAKVLRHRAGTRATQHPAVVAFSPDGKLLVSAGYDTTARVWDVESGVLRHALQANSDVRYAQFSPDGAQIATANWGNSAMLWNTASGVLLAAPLAHPTMVEHVSFSPRGDLLVTSCFDGTAKLWETRTGKLIRTCGNGKGFVMAATFSPNGKELLLRLFTGQVQTWSVETGKAVSPPLLHGGQVTDATLHPDGRRLLTACADGTVRLWDLLPQGSSEWPGLPGHLNVLSVSPKGALVATENFGGLLQIWDTGSRRSKTVALTSARSILQALFSTDEQRLLTIEIVSGQVRRDRPSQLEFKAWDVTLGKLLYRSTAPTTNPIPESIVFAASPDCTRVTFGTGPVVEAWDVAHGNLLWRSGACAANASAVGYSRDTTRVAFKSGRLVHLLDAATGMEVCPALTNRLLVASADFSPDGQLLAAACSDESYDNGEVRIWESATGKLRLSWEHKDGVPCLAFSPDGSRLATGTEPGMARVFDVPTGQPVTPYVRHGYYVRSVSFSQDRRLLATTCLGPGPATVRVWDAGTGEPISPPFAAPFEYINRVDQLTFLAGGRYLAGQNRRSCRIWNLEAGQQRIEDLLGLAQLLAGRSIDATGMMEPLEPSVLSDLWRRLHAHIPQAFAFVPREQATGSDWGVHYPRRIVSVPARDPKAKPRLIDLGPFYNANLDDFMDNVDNTFSSLPRGVHTFGSVEFEVRGLVHLTGKECWRLLGNRYPVSVEGIPMNRRCQSLHFLFGTQWVEGDGIRIGVFLIHYTDGEDAELPIVYGQDVRNWSLLQPDAPANKQSTGPGSIVWKAENPPVKRVGGVLPLYKRTWDNPRPGAEIKSMDFISTMTRCAPFLVAITVD